MGSMVIYVSDRFDIDICEKDVHMVVHNCTDVHKFGSTCLIRIHILQLRVDATVYQLTNQDMEVSPLIQGSHAVASPSGEYIAFIANTKLRICATHVPERYTEVAIRIQPKDVTVLRWNDESARIAVISAHHIEIIDLGDIDHRTRLDNGSGGLGRYSSVDFIGAHQLLVIWEYGKAKLWDLSNGKGVDINDVKTTCQGERWQIRPGSEQTNRQILATLSRPGADDILNIYFPALYKQLSSVKTRTLDAPSLSWSPDGRWLAILDNPNAASSIHFHTPDGHHFRSYPTAGELAPPSLGIKFVRWSPSSKLLALTKYDGTIILLNTRTFTPLAIIEHTTTVDQRSIPLEQRAPIWQEAVSASGRRSYASAPQPVSPPLTRTKANAEPSELGVAEARFSCDGSYLATRDERMLNTAWVWDMATLAAHAVLIQHSNVRKLHWHPTRATTLMIDCGEGIAYLFDASSREMPIPLPSSMAGNPSFCWIHSLASTHSALLVSSKTTFHLLYPEGQGDSRYEAGRDSVNSHVFDEGDTEDSLFDVLSGRKPMPQKTEQSYTERIDIEVETEEEDFTAGMDDTFRDMKSRKPVDPLDDSDIF